MTIRFLHAADIHLGYQQYGSNERYNDFARAFAAMVDDAIARQVDFVVLAGDLFHKRVIEPFTLHQATLLLKRLQEARIPALAVEGNHERPHYQDRFSWLDYLAEMGLLILLNPDWRDGQLLLDAWDGQAGAYLDLPGGVRVLGMKYYGAATPRMVQELVKSLAMLQNPRPPFTLLMLHAGLEGVLDNYSATLTRAQLEPLREYVDYLALGHIHKPFIQDDWIYNPGSLETNSTAEVEWDGRGYFLVEIDPAQGTGHVVTPVRSLRRPFELLTFAVDAYLSPEELYTALEQHLAREATAERVAAQPVVELRLVGGIAFEHADLDTHRVQSLVEAAFKPVVCNVRDHCASSGFEIRGDEALTRTDLEHQVIRELLERDVRKRAASAEWATLVLQLKQMALSDSAPEEIVATLRGFVERVPLESLTEENGRADHESGTEQL